MTIDDGREVKVARDFRRRHDQIWCAWVEPLVDSEVGWGSTELQAFWALLWKLRAEA